MAFLGRVLCFLGIHDFQVLDVVMSFGSGGGVAKVRCRRCDFTTTRHI